MLERAAGAVEGGRPGRQLPDGRRAAQPGDHRPALRRRLARLGRARLLRPAGVRQAAPAGSRLLSISTPGVHHIYQFAVRAPDGSERVVLTNVGSDRPHDRRQRRRHRRADRCRCSSARSLTATGGTTLGGQTLSSRTASSPAPRTGRWSGAIAEAVYAVRGPVPRRRDPDAVAIRVVRQPLRLTDGSQCLSSLDLDFEHCEPGPPKGGPDMQGRISIDGTPASFRCAQPTHPGDPHGAGRPRPPSARGLSDRPGRRYPGENPLAPSARPRPRSPGRSQPEPRLHGQAEGSSSRSGSTRLITARSPQITDRACTATRSPQAAAPPPAIAESERLRVPVTGTVGSGRRRLDAR